MAGVLDQEQLTDTSIWTSYSGYYSEAQGITVGVAGTISEIKLKLSKNGSPTGNYAVEIWSDDGTGKPDTKVSDTILSDISVLTGTRLSYSHAITGSPTYGVGDKFCIVVYYDGGDSDNCLEVGRVATNQYAGGTLSYSLDRITWTPATQDLAFQTYMLKTNKAGINMSLLGVG